MNEQQKERFEQYKAMYGAAGALTPGMISLIYSLVCIELEEEELQQYININGTCYTTPGGIEKQRPQWQQLRDNRQRKTIIVNRLQALGADPVEEDELDALLQLKDE